MLTTVSLLNPYHLKAGDYGDDYYVNPFDEEASDDPNGGGGDCKYKVCYYRSKDLLSMSRTVSSSRSNTNSGGGSLEVNVPSRSGTISGNGSTSTSGQNQTILSQSYAYSCNMPGGCLTMCTSVIGNTQNVYRCSAKTN